MPNDPRSASTFDLSAIYRSLGVRSPNTNVTLDTRTLTPTIQMADMSASFAPESFQARAVSTIQATAGANTFCRAEIKSLGRGGIVIERVQISFDETLNTQQAFLIRQANAVTFTSSVVPNVINVGGEDVLSTLQGGEVAVATNGVEVLFDLLVGGIPIKNYERPFNWFVPSANFFAVEASVPAGGAGDLRVTIQWREIPQARGQQ